MKKCPYCAGDMQDDAIFCPYCGQSLRRPARGPWFFQTGWLITAVLCVGPLAIPLIWLNPKFSLTKKIVWTAVVLLLTWGCWVLMQKSIQSIRDFYGILDQLN